MLIVFDLDTHLAATLRKLVFDACTIGERSTGPLSMLVGVLLIKLPTPGRLDTLIIDVKRIRTRGVSINPRMFEGGHIVIQALEHQVTAGSVEQGENPDAGTILSVTNLYRA
jgi:hypothetical protein